MPSAIGYPQRLTSRVSQERLDEVDRAKRLLRYADNIRKEREAVWEDNVSRYMGWQWELDNALSGEDLITVNMTFSTITTILPFITGGTVHFLVIPYSGDSTPENATLQQVFLNRIWRSAQLSGQKRLTEAAADSLIYGDGFVKVGFDIRTVVNRDPKGKAIKGSDKEILEFLADKVSPWDMWLDPVASDITNARFYVQRHILPLEVIKKDKRFFNTNDLGPDADTLSTGVGNSTRREVFSRGDNNIDDYIAIYDFYDAEERRLITFTLQQEEPLRWIEDVDRTVVQIPNHIIPDSPWHLSEVEQVSSLQDELNKTRSQMITHRRRNALKYMYREDLLSPEALDALQSSIQNIGVPITSDLPFEDLVQILAPQELSADYYNLTEMTRNEIFEITGVNEYLRGATPEIRRSATEASIIEGSSNVKINNKLRVVEDAAKEIGQMILDIAAEALPATDFEELTQYLTGREAEKVLIAQGQDVYDERGQQLDTELKLSPFIFKGRYEVDVERGSTELRNPLFKEQKYKEMFTTLASLAPTLLQLGVSVNLKRVLEFWLEASGVDDIDGVFADTPQDQGVGEAMALAELLGQGQGPSAAAGAPPIPGRQQSPAAPKPESTNPPFEPITEDNSGIIPAEAATTG